MPDTHGELVTDLILRAVAAMRERGDLPEFEIPKFTVARLGRPGERVYRTNAGAAIAAAQSVNRQNPGDLAHAIANPGDLAHAIATYLSEVVDIVPAYREVRSVTATDDGALTVTIRASNDQ